MKKLSALIPELDAIAARGDDRRRSNAIREIGALFVEGSDSFSPSHVELFDGILIELIPDTDAGVRAELSSKLAALNNAPRNVVTRLARDDELRVASPVLRLSPVITEETLADIARRKGQGHLMAIADRVIVTEPITDIIIRRGDREVIRHVAGNDGARLSTQGYSTLIKRASADGVLATTIGQRADISPPHLRELIVGAAGLVRDRILAVVKPEKRSEITHIIAEISGEPDPQAIKRDFAPAQRAILALHRAGDLDEHAVRAFAHARQYEECVVAIAAMSGVPIRVVDRLILGEKADSSLVLGKALGFEWKTVRALILLRQGPHRLPSAPDLDRALSQFDHLTVSTAQRVLEFWRMQRHRAPDAAGPSLAVAG